MTLPQVPTVGRIVHFTGTDGDTYAAIIARVYVDDRLRADNCVDLVTFGPFSIYHQPAVNHSPEPKPGHWSWPPRVS